MLYFKYIFHTYRRFFVLFGGFLLNATIGNLYTYNTMAPFIVKYMQNFSRSGNTINEGNTVWIFRLGIFGMGTSVTLSYFLMQKYEPSLIALLAGWLMSLTVLMMYYILKTYLTVVVLTYGFINGVATGVIYMVTINTSCSWFPNRKGTAVGFSIAGFGFSTFLFNFIQLKVIISDGINAIVENVPKSYLILGCIFVVLQLIGAMLISNPSMKEECETSQTSSDILGLKNEQEASADILPHKIMMEIDFWLLWITYALLTMCFIIISQHKEFGKLLRINDKKPFHLLTVVASLGSLCNSLGGIFWGVIIDRYRYKIVMFILSISLTVLLGTFYGLSCIDSTTIVNITIKSSAPSNGLIFWFFIWVMLLYFVASGMFSIFPLTCFKSFGQRAFVGNYGILFTSYSLGGMIMSFVFTYSGFEVKKSLDFHLWIFNTGAVMAALAALITLFYKGRSFSVFKCHATVSNM